MIKLSSISCLIGICIFILSSTNSKAIPLLDNDSSKTKQKIVLSAPRLNFDIRYGVFSHPTFGLNYFLNKNLFDKNLVFVRTGLSRFIDYNATNIPKCPLLAIGYSRGVFETSLGIMVKNIDLPKKAKGYPYFNIGFHTPIRRVTFHLGGGFPESIYIGAQVGLGEIKSKTVVVSDHFFDKQDKYDSSTRSHRILNLLHRNLRASDSKMTFCFLLGGRNLPGFELNYRFYKLPHEHAAFYIFTQMGISDDGSGSAWMQTLRLNLIYENIDFGCGVSYIKSSTFWVNKLHRAFSTHLGYVSNFRHGWGFKSGVGFPELLYVGLTRSIF